MRRKRKHLFVAVLALLLTQLCCTAIIYAADIGVTLNGKTLKLTNPPVLTNGRVMVPFRDIAEALNAKVDWNSTSKKITMTKSNTKVELTVGSKNVTINGTSSQLDTAPMIKGGSTMVPVRFVSEALGVTVNWTGSVVELKSTATDAVGSFSESDLAMTVEGKNWGLMQDGKPLVTAASKSVKLNCDETISCAYDGMDKLYSNTNIQISVLPIQGKETEIIDEIILVSDKYATAKGIKVGSDKKAVIAAYGDDYTTAGNIITYWAGAKNGLKTPRLYFELSNDKVKEIGIYGGRNAG